MLINKSDIVEMERWYRATFINSLPGFKCLQMAGTVNAGGIPNLSLLNSVFHLGANPALLGMVLRPQTAAHDTLNNIKSTGQYTLNNVLRHLHSQAHQTSASYASGVSEFETCGFEPFYSDNFIAPFVAQSTIKIGLELREIINVSLNNTTIVIGEVTLVILADDLLANDGYVDPVKAGTVTVAGLDSYFTAHAIGRLSYARPGSTPFNLMEDGNNTN